MPWYSQQRRQVKEDHYWPNQLKTWSVHPRTYPLFSLSIQMVSALLSPRYTKEVITVFDRLSQGCETPTKTNIYPPCSGFQGRVTWQMYWLRGISKPTKSWTPQWYMESRIISSLPKPKESHLKIRDQKILKRRARFTATSTRMSWEAFSSYEVYASSLWTSSDTYFSSFLVGRQYNGLPWTR